MRLFFYVFFFLCIISITFQSYGDYNKAKNLSLKIKRHIDTNVTLNDRFSIYNKVRNNIKNALSKDNQKSINYTQFLNDLAFYHNTNILKLVNYITSRKGSIERFELWKQEEILSIHLKELENRKNLDIGNDIIYIDKNNELIYKEEIYKLHYILGGDEEIYKLGKGYINVSNLYYERKIPFLDLIKEGPKKFLLYSDSFFEENGYIYTYKYETFFGINGNYGVYKSDFEEYGYDIDDAVFLRLQDAKNNVTIKPEIFKVVKSSIFGDINEYKHDFINKSLIDVLNNPTKDYSKTYEEILKLVDNLVKDSKNDDDKILAIYNRLIKNIEYPSTYDLSDFKIYSGLETFENKSGVCEGQALLFYYMLKIAGIKDVEYIDGYVVDSEDFPQIAHAWIQIEDYFYDPSFENIYQIDHKKYNYYKVPYDIIYSNRYNYRDIPDSFLNKSSNEFIDEVRNNKYNLTNKYKQGDYHILNDAFFRKKYNLSINKDIKLIDIYNKIEAYDYKLKNGKSIKKDNIFEEYIEYISIKSLDENIMNILDSIDYNLDNYVIIKIYNNDTFIGYGLTDSIKKR